MLLDMPYRIKMGCPDANKSPEASFFVDLYLGRYKDKTPPEGFRWGFAG